MHIPRAPREESQYSTRGKLLLQRWNKYFPPNGKVVQALRFAPRSYKESPQTAIQGTKTTKQKTILHPKSKTASLVFPTLHPHYIHYLTKTTQSDKLPAYPLLLTAFAPPLLRGKKL